MRSWLAGWLLLDVGELLLRCAVAWAIWLLVAAAVRDAGF